MESKAWGPGHDRTALRPQGTIPLESWDSAHPHVTCSAHPQVDAEEPGEESTRAVPAESQVTCPVCAVCEGPHTSPVKLTPRGRHQAGQRSQGTGRRVSVSETPLPTKSDIKDMQGQPWGTVLGNSRWHPPIPEPLLTDLGNSIHCLKFQLERETAAGYSGGRL